MKQNKLHGERQGNTYVARLYHVEVIAVLVFKRAGRTEPRVCFLKHGNSGRMHGLLI
jgi:hypothetical protein